VDKEGVGMVRSGRVEGAKAYEWNGKGKGVMWDGSRWIKRRSGD